MPTYSVELPDGSEFHVESPTELNDAQVWNAVNANLPKEHPFKDYRKPEGAVMSALRSFASGIPSAIGTGVAGALGATGGGAVGGPGGAAAGGIAAGAAGGALGEEFLKEVIGEDAYQENLRQMEANRKVHEIASSLGSMTAALPSMMGGGGPFKGLAKEGAGLLETGARALPETLATGARMAAGGEAAKVVGGEEGISDALKNTLQGAITMGPVAFVPAARTILESTLAKAPADAAFLGLSNALYDRYVNQNPDALNNVWQKVGTDVPGFMLLNAIQGYAHGMPFRSGKEPTQMATPEGIQSGLTSAPEVGEGIDFDKLQQLKGQSPKDKAGLAGQLRQEEVLSEQGDPKLRAAKKGIGVVDQAQIEQLKSTANAEALKSAEELRRSDEEFFARFLKAKETVAKSVTPDTGAAAQAASEAIDRSTVEAATQSERDANEIIVRHGEQQESADQKEAQAVLKAQEEEIKRKEKEDAKQDASPAPPDGVRTEPEVPQKAEEPAASKSGEGVSEGGQKEIDHTKPVVASAVYRDPVSGKVYYGRNHPEALARAKADGVDVDPSKYKSRKSRETDDFGFLVRHPDGTTSLELGRQGRIKSRLIAKESGQEPEGKGPLHSNQFNMDYREGESHIEPEPEPKPIRELPADQIIERLTKRRVTKDPAGDALRELKALGLGKEKLAEVADALGVKANERDVAAALAETVPAPERGKTERTAFEDSTEEVEGKEAIETEPVTEEKEPTSDDEILKMLKELDEQDPEGAKQIDDIINAADEDPQVKKESDDLYGDLHGGLPLLNPKLIKRSALHAYSLTKDVAKWAGAMVKKFGEVIKPYLQRIWNHIKDAAYEPVMRGLEKIGAVKSVFERGNEYNDRIRVKSYSDAKLAQQIPTKIVQEELRNRGILLKKDIVEPSEAQRDELLNILKKVKENYFNEVGDREARKFRDVSEDIENTENKPYFRLGDDVFDFENLGIVGKYNEAKSLNELSNEARGFNTGIQRAFSDIGSVGKFSPGEIKKAVAEKAAEVKEAIKPQLTPTKNVEPAHEFHAKKQAQEKRASDFKEKSDEILKNDTNNKAARIFAEAQKFARDDKKSVPEWIKGEFERLKKANPKKAEAFKAAYDKAARGMDSKEQADFVKETTRELLYKEGKSLQDIGRLPLIEDEDGNVKGSVLQDRSLGYIPRHIKARSKFKTGQFKEREYRTVADMLIGGDNLETWNFGDAVGRYMRRAEDIRSRPQFLADAINHKDKDGNYSAIIVDQRPLASEPGSLAPLTTVTSDRLKQDEETWVDDKTKYKQLEHYTVRQVPIAVRMDDGTISKRMATVALSPELAKIYKQEVGHSAIKEAVESPSQTIGTAAVKAGVRGLDKLSAIQKASMFFGSAFHGGTVATRLASYGVNPLFKTGTVDLNPDTNPNVKRALKDGLMLWREKGEHDYQEYLDLPGLGGNSPANRFLKKIAGGWLFEKYIPEAMMKVYDAMLPRTMKDLGYEKAGKNKDGTDAYRYTGKGEPKMTEDDIRAHVAKMTNEAVGHLNFRLMGRDKTLRHLASWALLSPQFTESTVKSIVSGIKGTPALLGAEAGKQYRQQALALWGTAIMAFAAARVINGLINDGDTKLNWKDPFNIVVGDRAYSMRMLPHDALSMIMDPSHWAQGREGPLAKLSMEELNQRNYRGEKITHAQALANFGAGYIPMSIQNFLPELHNLVAHDRKNPVMPIESVMNLLGINASDHSPIRSTYERASKWKEANGEPNEGSYPTSHLTPLKRNLENADPEGAAQEFEKLVTEEAQKNPGRRISEIKGRVMASLKSSMDHPFAGTKDKEKKFFNSLNDNERKEYIYARQKLARMYDLAKIVTGAGSGEIKTSP